MVRLDKNYFDHLKKLAELNSICCANYSLIKIVKHCVWRKKNKEKCIVTSCIRTFYVYQGKKIAHVKESGKNIKHPLDLDQGGWPSS